MRYKSILLGSQKQSLTSRKLHTNSCRLHARNNQMEANADRLVKVKLAPEMETYPGGTPYLSIRGSVSVFGT